MTMIERPSDPETMDRVPAAWLWAHVPAPLECQCPEACLIDHDN